VNALPSQSGHPVTVEVDLGGGSLGDLTASPPPGVTLVIRGNGTTSTIVGHSPALTVTAGSVVVTGVTLTTSTNAPTVLVTGGSLELRNDVVQESDTANQVAVRVTGGSADLGTAGDPGQNAIVVRGPGTAFQVTSPGQLTQVGDSISTGLGSQNTYSYKDAAGNSVTIQVKGAGAAALTFQTWPVSRTGCSSVSWP